MTSVDSTNLEVRKLVENGDFGPVWVCANQQTGGRARRGRDWISKPGNLYASALYPHNGDAAWAAKLTFVAALAVTETLGTYINPEIISIKWPNDVLVEGKKISGILLENGYTYDRSWAIVGIGINLEHHPQDTETPATHLLAHIAKNAPESSEPFYPGPNGVLALLTGRFAHWFDLYERDGFVSIRETWLAHASGMGEPVTVKLTESSFSGTALGLDETGALEVRLESGVIKKVHAGDVFLPNRRKTR